jgi:hypothetical protein
MRGACMTSPPKLPTRKKKAVTANITEANQMNPSRKVPPTAIAAAGIRHNGDRGGTL